MPGAKHSILDFLPHMVGDIKSTSPLNYIWLRVLMLVDGGSVLFDGKRVSHGHVLLGLLSEKGLQMISIRIRNIKRFK